MKHKRERRVRLTTGKVAVLLGISPVLVRAMCERGDFPHAVQVGHWWRIPLNDVTRYLPPDGEPPEVRPADAGS